MLKKEIKIVNEMTKSELKQNITKIEQLLQSENYEAGFELLKTINELELNETLADLIQNKVEERYFQENSVQKEIDKGLEILEVLLPNLTSLDLKNSYLEKLDISKFTNLSSLDLEDCYSIETLDGLDKLKHLTDLNLINPQANLSYQLNEYLHQRLSQPTLYVFDGYTYYLRENINSSLNACLLLRP